MHNLKLFYIYILIFILLLAISENCDQYNLGKGLFMIF